MVHRAHKRLLPTYDVFDESRYFEPGQEVSVFDYKGHRVGLTICEDAWNDADIFPRPIYHMDPVALMARAGSVTESNCQRRGLTNSSPTAAAKARKRPLRPRLASHISAAKGK